MRVNEAHRISLVFSDNALAQTLFGEHSANLTTIENRLGLTIAARGADITLSGDSHALKQAERVLQSLYDRLKRGSGVSAHEVDAALRMVQGQDGHTDAMNIEIHTKKCVISPRTPTQARYLRAIDDNELVLGFGPAGTGKTYLAVAKAVEHLLEGKVERIILSRPAIEAGEQLGFLPGDMKEKVDPYLRPLYDALQDMIPGDQLNKRMEMGDIEVAPLAFMRGRTLSNAFVILDEAQNTTAVQMKMFLTRLGENSRMVVTGDLSQVDLPRGTRSGLRDAREVLRDITGIQLIEFHAADIVRHKMVTRIVKAYDKSEARCNAAAAYETNLTTSKTRYD